MSLIFKTGHMCISKNKWGNLVETICGIFSFERIIFIQQNGDMGSNLKAQKSHCSELS